MEEVVVNVTGSAGPMEERMVTTLLIRLPGVALAEAGFFAGQIRVMFNPHQQTVNGLLTALSNAGYDVML